MTRRTLIPLATIAAASLAGGCGGGGEKKAAPQYPAQHFASRPDLRPPVFEITTPGRGSAPGYLFLAPKMKLAQAGPLILDDSGQVVWFHPLETQAVADFRVQRYQGRPVLTWWRGKAPKGIGSGYYVIFDRSYRKLAIVRAGNGLIGDIHEFELTPRGTALFTVYNRERRDLSALGGPKDATVVEGVVQELDLATRRVLFEWHSLDHVDLDESYVPVPPAKRGPSALWDYFHINSIDEDRDGDLIVSARNTRAVYKIRRRDGKVLWRLGGKRSDFALGPGVKFAWQHDARRQPDGTLTLFDNGAEPKVEKRSRVLVLRLDTDRMRATLVRSLVHPKGLLSGSQGNAQFLPDGHVLVGWGANPYVTEYDGDGHVVFDARFNKTADSYRAYRFPWTGLPAARPAIAVRSDEDGDTRVFASWNGATQVARWQVLAGDDAERLGVVGGAAKSGFETAIPVRTDARYVAVRALGRRGRTLGTSRAVERSG